MKDLEPTQATQGPIRGLLGLIGLGRLGSQLIDLSPFAASRGVVFIFVEAF